MKRIVILFIVIFILFVNIAGWAQTKVTLFSGEIIVKGEDVYLKDVAKIEGTLKDALSTVRIIASPSPGGIRKIEKEYIRLRLKQLGFQREDVTLLGPDVITIKRAFQKIDKDLIRELAEEKIRDIIPSWAKRYQIILNIPRFSDIAPLGDVDIFIDFPSGNEVKGKTISFPVTISVGGKRWKRLYITAKVSLYADFPIAITSIKRNERISKNSYKIEERKVERISFPYVSPTEIEGYVACKNIYPGTIIDLTCISKPYQVKRGDIVEVVLKRGSIIIMLKAQALENGSYGDTIELKNLKSGKKFTGIVQDYGLVIVK